MLAIEVTKAYHRKGFTLIELSIVLVIIGLIVGGVLVGQNLISASKIRATVGQVEKFNTAVNAFRSKYGALPGDISATAAGQAAAFGLFFFTSIGNSTAYGDNNGVIEGGSSGGWVARGETLAFWRHLSEANLIDGAYGISGNSEINAVNGETTGVVTVISQSLPPAHIGRGNHFIVYGNEGKNYYQLLPVTSITPPIGTYAFGTSGITPTEAYGMDVKIDDGAPNTGNVLARSIFDVNQPPGWALVSTSGRCIIGTSGLETGATYNRVGNTGGSDPICSLRFQFN